MLVTTPELTPPLFSLYSFHFIASQASALLHSDSDCTSRTVSPSCDYYFPVATCSSSREPKLQWSQKLISKSVLYKFQGKCAREKSSSLLLPDFALPVVDVVAQTACCQQQRRPHYRNFSFVSRNVFYSAYLTGDVTHLSPSSAWPAKSLTCNPSYQLSIVHMKRECHCFLTRSLRGMLSAWTRSLGLLFLLGNWWLQECYYSSLCLHSYI